MLRARSVLPQDAREMRDIFFPAGRIEVPQITLSAITTAGFVAAVFGAGPVGVPWG